MTVHDSNLSKREQQRTERRNGILDVAKRAFLEDGYGATAMSSIAARLGGSKGTLWSYFRTKEELFEAVIEREARPVTLAQQTALDADGKLRRTLVQLCANLIARMTSPEGLALLRVVISESGRSPEIGRMFWDGGPGRIEPMLMDYFSEQVARKKLKNVDPAEMADFLVSLCTGRNRMRMLLNLEPPGSIDVEDEAAWVVGRFLAVYRRG
jgi:AcrR family transcriptional regulator